MSQKVYVGGESVGGKCGYLLGRIKFWKRGGISRLGDGCILCVPSERELREVLGWIGCGMRIAGIILLCPICRLDLATLSVPCFIASCELCEDAFEGHIALIDFGASRLLLDPGFEALSEYVARDESAEKCGRVRRGILKSAGELSISGDLFEGTLSLIEDSGATPLCISLDLLHTDRDAMARDAEALFRAAVYGEISIMLSGFCSPCEIESANALLHSVFCELEAEGREINGCVAHGLLVDAPIWLTERQRLGRCDFLCFDFDLLTSRLLGVGVMEELKKTHIDSLCRFWESYREAFCGIEGAELRAISRAQNSKELFYDWVDFMNISEIYDLEQKNT